MRSPDETRKLVHSYIEMMCSTDIDGIAALFAEDASAEDPVGGDIQTGIEAVRNFYATNAPALQLELTGPICVAGKECAFPITAAVTIGNSKSYLDAVDVFSFGDDGKITKMRAFWNPAELRPER
jgi:steroid delta-isomerase